MATSWCVIKSLLKFPLLAVRRSNGISVFDQLDQNAIQVIVFFKGKPVVFIYIVNNHLTTVFLIVFFLAQEATALLYQ